MGKEHLLVPIKLQALVIDDLVIDKKATIKIGANRNMANDGKWSPLAHDYNPVAGALKPGAPKPFYGAGRTDGAESADQLILPSDSRALPQKKDRGVYLHWVLPSGLRHAHKPNTLDFPALPDQWLIVRFLRDGASPQARAWFLDGGLAVSSDGPTNLLLPSGNSFEARRVGKAAPLDQFNAEDFKGEHTTITATGNQWTASPTFTGFVAENRNILSWHDTLDDIREPDSDGQVPKKTALTYLLLGWYHDSRNEPFVMIPPQLEGKSVMEALGWKLDSSSPPSDLLKRECLFHGVVAHINYWNSDTHKGPMLGYPGSPSVGGVLGDAPPSFKVGVGNSAEDALVSLVSSEYSKDDAPNLWKALEAVIYRQPESIVSGWNAAPRDQAVHQNWFSVQEAGKIWTIRPRPRHESAFPADADKTISETSARATSGQLALLKQLNEAQSAADAFGREIAALQQDLYARWWKLCEQSRLNDMFADLTNDEGACRKLAGRVQTLLDDRETQLGRVQTLVTDLESKLSPELELRFDAAPRFWAPNDPVIVVKNCGLPTKHVFPRPLLCRLSEQIVTAAEVTVDKKSNQFRSPIGLDEINRAVKTHFAQHDSTLSRLITEGSIIEQAVGDLVERTLKAEGQFSSADEWRAWTNRINEDLAPDDRVQPRDQMKFTNRDRSTVAPHLWVDFWERQPWSPLFLDWQITWSPTPHSDKDFTPVWRMGEHDFELTADQPPPAKGFTVRGRSLLSPIDGRIFKKPIEMLRDLLKEKHEEGVDEKPAFPPAVREILLRYESAWDKTLAELERAGMMGQSLSGLHQALLGRDVTLPRVMPDSARPWVNSGAPELGDNKMRPLLDPHQVEKLAAELLAPPAADDSNLPFNLLRAGALKIDELWLVDDFGQWADLLRGTSAGGAAGQVFNPRSRWHQDRFVLAMPPRVVQPARLNFRFTTADESGFEGECDPALSPICGWIFFNPLDQVLVLCNRDGRLAGEIAITEENGRFRVQRQTRGGAIKEISNSNLRAFAQSLIQEASPSKPRLLELLSLIDRALERIRPSSARREAGLFGRPLALVNAALGLELFGKAWTDPKDKPPAARPSGTGDAALDSLRLRVNLGCRHNVEDGLIGYFKGTAFDCVIPAELPRGLAASGYIADPEQTPLFIKFDALEPLTLLIDPWGSVQASVGLVPAKSITLAQPELDKALARMEASFRVGPILVQGGKIALPTPVVEKGQWNFSGPLTNDLAALVTPLDTKSFSDQPVVAAEGRLLLVSEE